MPQWGSYLEEDPIGLAGGENLHAYVGGRPTRYVDSSGLLMGPTTPLPPSVAQQIAQAINAGAGGTTAESAGGAAIGGLAAAAVAVGAAIIPGEAGDPEADDMTKQYIPQNADSQEGDRNNNDPNANQNGQSCPAVTFGHGARHLDGTNLSQSDVEGAIQNEINQIVNDSSGTGNFWGNVNVNGQSVYYRAYTLPNGVINVGTYTPGAP